jgi:hypothetical protein
MTEALAIPVGVAVVVLELLQPSVPARTRRGSKRKKIEARKREGFPKREGLLSRARINVITFMIDRHFRRILDTDQSPVQVSLCVPHLPNQEISAVGIRRLRTHFRMPGNRPRFGKLPMTVSQKRSNSPGSSAAPPSCRSTATHGCVAPSGWRLRSPCSHREQLPRQVRTISPA